MPQEKEFDEATLHNRPTVLSLHFILIHFFSETAPEKETPAEATGSVVFGSIFFGILGSVFITLLLLDINTYINNFKFMRKCIFG